MNEKTHFRKAFNSPYLSSADIVAPTVLTIKNVTLSGDQTKKTKDVFNTAYFVESQIRQGEPLKPMILNAHNSKILKDMVGSPFIDDWNNILVTIYVDCNVRFGRDTVEGLRISPIQPEAVKPELVPGTKFFTNAVLAYKRDGHLDTVLKRMTIAEPVIAAIKEAAKNETS